MMMTHFAHRLCRQQRRIACLLFLLVVGVIFASEAVARRLSSQGDAQRLGLTRAWFAQARVDASRNQVERAVLGGDRLTVLTTAGVVQEMDALTGATLWVAPLGNPNYPSLGPAASDNYVAVLNGSTLYVLDRVDGKPIKVRPVGGAPGASPALAPGYVFVPLVIGRIEAYPLEKTTLTPWYYQSYGRAMVAPIATEDSIVWTTDAGHLYVGRAKELGVRFRLETGSAFAASPAYRKPYVFAANMAGEVFAVNELTGGRLWKYATGFPVLRAPAAVGERVYVTSEEPVLHCIDAARGATVWEAPGITQFAAASPTRVYGVDSLGRLVVLDAATGNRLGDMMIGSATTALVNDQTDRLYFVSNDGMVQCLHEEDSKEPLYHVPKLPEQPAVPPQEAAPAAPSTPAAPATPAEADDDPFGFEAGESDDEDAEMPAEMPEAPAEEEDPFAF